MIGIRVWRVVFNDALGEDTMYFNGTSLLDVQMNFNRHYPTYDFVAAQLATG